jgi:hypothetical protein
MNELLFESTWNVVSVTKKLFVNANEIIAIYNTFWISLHWYVIWGWK